MVAVDINYQGYCFWCGRHAQQSFGAAATQNQQQSCLQQLLKQSPLVLVLVLVLALVLQGVKVVLV